MGAFATLDPLESGVMMTMMDGVLRTQPKMPIQE
jgi:hypothetical protein